MVRHYHHHYHFSYVTSIKRHFVTTAVIVVLLSILTLTVFRYFTPSANLVQISSISFLDLIFASIFSLYRLVLAYIISLAISVPLALLIVKNEKYERVLLPFFDILQSIPVLAFFPVLVLVFINLQFFEGAAIFILVMTMLWSMVFSMIGGLKTIPQDIKSATLVFNARGLKKLMFVTLPSIFPQIITGSLLAWAAGWDILIVAEVLHTYIPNGDSSSDLFGLGALLVNASLQGNKLIFLITLITLILLIAVTNFFIWQRLLHHAERYKFD